MRAIDEMRQLLSTLMVHCLKAPSMEARHAPARSYIAPRQKRVYPSLCRARYRERKPEFETTTLVKTGWLFKKSEKKAGVVHAGKAAATLVCPRGRHLRGAGGRHNRQNSDPHVLSLEQGHEGRRRDPAQGAPCTCASAGGAGKRAAAGVDCRNVRPSPASAHPRLFPQETMGVKGGMGKTKGTEYRVTLNTPKREWELGSGEEDTAKEDHPALKLDRPAEGHREQSKERGGGQGSVDGGADRGVQAR